jgi:hypothetical protein
MLDIVIARYNEDIEWIKDIPISYNVIVYNKGEALKPIDRQFTEIQLDNIDGHGRESHSYLYHIINNYDNLNPTIFTQGNPYVHTDIIKMCKTFELTDGKRFIQSDSIQTEKTDTVYEHWNGLGIDFRYYYKKIFGNYYHPDIITFHCGAIFSVPESMIKCRSIDFYKQLFELLKTDMKFAWTMERLWAFILC